MFRKSALAMAMLGALTSSNVVALGLGEIELKSALNQPLNAEVELLSATQAELEELKVSIGSPQAFTNAGIERPLFLNKFKFDVTRNADGKAVVRVTSRDVVREPFLDFLLEISWSKGRLLREYTVLVDPPLTMPAPPPVTQAPAQDFSTRSPAAADSGRRVTHTAQLPPVSVSPGEYGPTRRNDTLWRIAETVRPDSGVSIEQTMQGLLRANPEAFVDNNINNLKTGYVLRVPSREELTSMSRGEARRESQAQYAAWRQARALPPSDAPLGAGEIPATTEGLSGSAAPAGESRLQLVAPDLAEGAAGAEGAATLQDMQRDLIMANEALEAQRRQGEDMSERLSMLEEQIVNMQRLIQLKDDELARLQAQTAGEFTDPSVVTEAAAESTQAEVADMPMPASEATEGGAGSDGVPQAMVTDAADPAMVEQMVAEEADVMAEEAVAAGEEVAASEEIAAEVAEAMAAIDAETDAIPLAETPDAVTGLDTESAVTPEVFAPVMPETSTPSGLVDRLLENPLWLGAGGVVLALLAFFGLRRKRGVETEFQESILQASTGKANQSDSEIVASQPESTNSKSAESSLLSEFAVSDMGSLKHDGEADPLAEADVYLAYGRFQQAEDLIKDALEKDAERDDLNLKLLEVFLAGKNQVAFDEQAQGILARLENSKDPVWEKVAEMGRELSPENPMYQLDGEAVSAADGMDEIDELSEDFNFDLGEKQPGDDVQDMATAEDEGLDFDLDLSFDASASADGEKPDSMEFTPPDMQAEAPEKPLDVDMDSVEPDRVDKDNDLDLDLEGFELEAAVDEAEDEVPGDGELANLDEVSTKLDLARAYIDMGDPDGAKSILDEVMEEGSDDQKDEARNIMAQMS